MPTKGSPLASASKPTRLAVHDHRLKIKRRKAQRASEMSPSAALMSKQTVIDSFTRTMSVRVGR